MSDKGLFKAPPSISEGEGYDRVGSDGCEFWRMKGSKKEPPAMDCAGKDLPGLGEMADIGGESGAAPPPPRPHGWEELFSNGVPYYYHRPTARTQWSPPPGWH